MESAKIEPIRRVLRVLVGIGFIGIGLIHFVTPEPFLKIMPNVLPWHLGLVYLSGAAEILGGVGLLVPKTRRMATWGLLLLLLAVFPANINMAVNEIYLEGMPREAWLLWVRLPFQLVFAAMVYWVGLVTPKDS